MAAAEAIDPSSLAGRMPCSVCGRKFAVVSELQQLAFLSQHATVHTCPLTCYCTCVVSPTGSTSEASEHLPQGDSTLKKAREVYSTE